MREWLEKRQHIYKNADVLLQYSAGLKSKNNPSGQWTLIFFLQIYMGILFSWLRIFTSASQEDKTIK